MAFTVWILLSNLGCTPVPPVAGNASSEATESPISTVENVATTTPATAQTPTTEEKPDVVKFESPAECYRAYQIASNNQDWSASWHCMSEAMRNHTLGYAAIQLERFGRVNIAGDASAQCQEVLKKHGLDRKDLTAFLQLAGSPNPDSPAGFMQIGASIKDPLLFLEEANKALELVEAAMAARRRAPPVEARDRPLEELGDTKIDGDRAVAKIAGNDDPTLVPIYFQRERDSWVLAYSDNEPEWKKPIKGRFLFSDVKAKEAAPAANALPAGLVTKKFETPEACFESLQAANKSQDVATALACMSETMRNFMLGNMAFNLERYAYLSDAGATPAQCQAVLKKHGLYGKDLMGFLQVVDSPQPGGAPLGFMQIGASIKDPAAFMTEAKNAMDTLKDPAKFKVPAEDAPTVKLGKVTIDGDQATALTETGEDQTPQKVVFKRENGSWVIALGEDEPDWKKPIQGRFLFSDVKAEE